MRKEMRLKPITNTFGTGSKTSMNASLEKEPENEKKCHPTLLIPASVSFKASIPVAIKLPELIGKKDISS